MISSSRACGEHDSSHESLRGLEGPRRTLDGEGVGGGVQVGASLGGPGSFG